MTVPSGTVGCSMRISHPIRVFEVTLARDSAGLEHEYTTHVLRLPCSSCSPRSPCSPCSPTPSSTRPSTRHCLSAPPLMPAALQQHSISIPAYTAPLPTISKEATICQYGHMATECHMSSPTKPQISRALTLDLTPDLLSFDNPALIIPIGR